MKKTKLPVAWIIFLAAVCALAATVLQSARKAEQEFLMAGKNVSQLDTEQILTHIRKAQRCGKNTAFYVNGDNFELQLTADFELTDGGTVRFFYPEGNTTYSAQLRIFSDSGKFFVTQRSEWTQQQTQYQLGGHLGGPEEYHSLFAAGGDSRAFSGRGRLLRFADGGRNAGGLRGYADLSRKRRGRNQRLANSSGAHAAAGASANGRGSSVSAGSENAASVL